MLCTSRGFSVAAPAVELTAIWHSSVTLPLPLPFVAFLKLTASSRPLAPPSDPPKCLRFGHWLTLCTVNIHLLTYLLTYLLTCDGDSVQLDGGWCCHVACQWSWTAAVRRLVPCQRHRRSRPAKVDPVSLCSRYSEATFIERWLRVRVPVYRFQQTRVYMYFSGGRSHWYEFCTSTGYLWISLVRAVSVQVVFLSNPYEVNNAKSVLT